MSVEAFSYFSPSLAQRVFLYEYFTIRRLAYSVYEEVYIPL